MWFQWKLWILSYIPPLQPEVPPEDSLLFQSVALTMWLMANENYTVYNECTSNGGWIFRKNCTNAATSITASHGYDVTRYKTVFFINYTSLLTQEHCLLPQCYCGCWNWQNTEQNVQCSSLSLYRKTAYSGQYSGHCVLLVLLVEKYLFVIR